MKYRLSNRVTNMAESETLAMTRIARELRANGKDVISLSIGEPDFNTPGIVKDAAKHAIDDNWSHYPPVPGYPDVLQAISDKFKRDNHLDYRPEQIVISTGAKQSIYQVVMSLVNPGDEVIIPTPYWVSYREIVKMAEGNPVYIRSNIENDFKITPQQLQKAITPRTRLLMFSTPSNPTGMLYSRDELLAIAEVLKTYPHVMVMADEIYEHIRFEGKHESMAQFDFIKEQVITVNGVAKGYAMTGWRAGFIGAPLPVAQACSKLQGQITSGSCSISQRAVLAAMQINPDTSEDIIQMKNIFKRRRDMLYQRLSMLPGFKVCLPQGAFYFFPDISELFGKHVPDGALFETMYGKKTIENATDLCMYLLYDANVATVQGDAFGDSRCIRMSYATADTLLVEAMNRIEHAIYALK
ncbi:MAG: pyridoxal phosphate-dependent aminotransferase [Bacteroidales bacterium]|nr:pyridoxal phosphate-dependent aminotransferase [Bacteroidales bacterium]